MIVVVDVLLEQEIFKWIFNVNNRKHADDYDEQREQKISSNKCVCVCFSCCVANLEGLQLLYLLLSSFSF